MLTTSIIDGENAPARGPTRSLVDPATGKVVAEANEATTDDIDKATAAGRHGLKAWSAYTPGERAQVLNRAADLIENRLDEVVALEVEDTGKPWPVARDGEIPFAADNLRFFAGAARSLDSTGAGVFTRGYTSMTLRQPIGVVAGIVPWNFPLVIAVWKAGAALAAGNAVVLKPAPQTPRSSIWLANILHQAGVPSAAVQVVLGDGTVGDALVASPSVDMVSVTGSTATGRAVMTTAALGPKKVHLELGGKAPALVLDDADIEDMAAALTMAATYNTGQDCTAATRVYVARSRFDDAVDALRARMAAVRPGPPANPDTHVGPLISAEHRDRVAGFVDRARTDGAEVLTGGRPIEGAGFFYEPTLLVPPSQRSEVVVDEIFGPVLVVLPVEDETDGLHHANDTSYGLASSVWSRDVERALRVSHQMQAGVTWVNDHLPITSEMPHGGVKGSGFGKDLSHEALLEYSTTHHLMLKHASQDPHENFRPA